MPILPIDLQIMFSRMDQIGKEQAGQKQVSTEAQAAHASEMVKETEQKDNSVNESRDVGEGIEGVNEEQNKREKKSRAQKKKNKTSERKNGSRDRSFYSDPALGRHIDIDG